MGRPNSEASKTRWLRRNKGQPDDGTTTLHHIYIGALLEHFGEHSNIAQGTQAKEKCVVQWCSRSK